MPNITLTLNPMKRVSTRSGGSTPTPTREELTGSPPYVSIFNSVLHLNPLLKDSSLSKESKIKIRTLLGIIEELQSREQITEQIRLLTELCQSVDEKDRDAVKRSLADRIEFLSGYKKA